MKVANIVTRPLSVPNKAPYHWAHGIINSADVILVEVHTDEGITGYGESVSTPSAVAIQSLLDCAGKICIGRSPFENTRLMSSAYHALFQAAGTCSAPRFSGQVFAGLEMALWDVMGKAADCSVHELLGGAVRDEIQYFGFAQGQSAEEIASDAAKLAESGSDVIYIKVGRGDEFDLETVKQVRCAIGNKRLRIDPNEKWNIAHATRMIPKMAAFDVELIEQPTHCESILSLAQVREKSSIPISADQLVFTPQDVFNVCREKAADMIVLGLHETGGIHRFCKAAHIAEAAGINICTHGLHETGITTCATNQVSATLPNLDDGNQYMNHLLAWDIIKSPDLTLVNGKLPIIKGPGLGFELDWDAVSQAEELFKKNS